MLVVEHGAMKMAHRLPRLYKLWINLSSTLVACKHIIE